MNGRAHPCLPLVWDVAEPSRPAVSRPLRLEPADDQYLLLAAVIAQLARYGLAAGLSPMEPADGQPRWVVQSTVARGTAAAGPAATLAGCIAAARAAVGRGPGQTRFSVIIESDDLSREIGYEFAADDTGRHWLTVRSPTTPRGTAPLDRIASHYAAVLRAVVSRPASPLADIGHLTTREAAIIAKLNETHWTGSPASCIHQLVSAAASRDPGHPAVSQGAERMSFGDLERATAALAARLQQADIAVGDRVAVLARRSIEFVVAALAVMRAGAAYVPLDPQLPAHRLRTLLRLSAARVILAEPDSADGLAGNVLTIPSCAELRASHATLADPGVTSGHLAYLIFTSGSTGEPKGVLLDHAGRANMIADLNERLGLSARDRTLVVSSPGFDMSVYDIFGTLAAGATVVLPDRGREHDADHWAQLILDEQITVWHSVPSALTLLLNIWPGYAAAQARPAIRVILAGGDWIPAGQPARARAAFPLSRFYSLGGATEVSVDSVIHEVDQADPTPGAIPYGRALRNQTAYILDARGGLAGLDQAGELALGGVGVGWGYQGHPALTATRFVPDPFGPTPGGRLYLTGDQARLRDDGQIELLGRLDHQVKVDGVRIELGEVQAALESDPRVSEAAAVAARDASGRVAGIAAFVVAAEPWRHRSPALATALRARLEELLPRAMVPASIDSLDAMPLNPNGKVDRRLLQLWAHRPRAAQPQAARPALAGRRPSRPPAELVTTVVGICAQVLGLESAPSPDTGVLALGCGSLAAMQISLRLNRLFGADLTARDVMSAETIADLAELAGAQAGATTDAPIPRQPR